MLRIAQLIQESGAAGNKNVKIASLWDSGVRYAKFLSMQYFININILQNSLIGIDIDILPNSLALSIFSKLSLLI